MPRRIPMPRTDTTLVALSGGLDQISPPPLAKPGTIKEGQNFEVIENFTGGYRRIDGYDQFDGRLLPQNTTVRHLKIKLLSQTVTDDVTKNPVSFSELTGKGITLQNLSTTTPTIYGEMVSATSIPSNVEQSDPISLQAVAGWIEVAINQGVFGSGRWKGVHATAPTSDVENGDWYYQTADGVSPDNLFWRRAGVWSAFTNPGASHRFLGPVTTLPSVGDSLTWKGGTRTFTLGDCVIHEGVLKIYRNIVGSGRANGSDIVVSLVNVNGDFVAYPNKEDTDPSYVYLLDTIDPLAVGELIGVVAEVDTSVGTSHREIQCTAANLIRSRRDGVPGSGPIRGVVQIGSDVFAFRDNTAADAQKVYKAGANGWDEVDLGYIFNFDAGNGDLIPEGTAIAYDAGRSVIRRIVTYTGSWADGDARGLMLIDTPSVAFPGTTGEVTVTHSGSTTTTFNIHNNVREHTLNPGGRWQFVVENFKGQSETERVYGVSAGTNHIIEFDGERLVPIETSLTYTGTGSTRSTSATNDYPTNITEYQNHLFYSVASSIFCSGPGEPYQWSALDGGVEFAMGHTVTGMMPQSGLDAGAAMAIFTTQKIIMLHGTGQVTFETSLVQANFGAIQDTVHQLERTYFMNSLGLFDLESAFRYSQFQQASHSYVVWPFLREKLGNVVGSVVNRTKNQYRIFFSDGTALYGTFVNGRPSGYMNQVFPHRFYVVWNGFDSSGSEVTYAGDNSTGDVYKMDSGNTFNGEPIDARIQLQWDTAKMPRTLKTYRRATLFLEGHDYVEYTFGYRLAYEKNDELQQDIPESLSADVGSLSSWDTFRWDVGRWDGAEIQPAEISINGSGESISFVIASNSDCSGAFDVKSLSYDYTPRRKLRG